MDTGPPEEEERRGGKGRRAARARFLEVNFGILLRDEKKEEGGRGRNRQATACSSEGTQSGRLKGFVSFPPFRGRRPREVSVFPLPPPAVSVGSRWGAKLGPPIITTDEEAEECYENCDSLVCALVPADEESES